ncbi:MAG: hypothetical protein JKX84_08870 [Flavobacteriales bacterium]|nr:hypothetical protein [Flavobacteriales bacterium]
MLRYIIAIFAFTFSLIPNSYSQHTVIMKDGTVKKGEVKWIKGPTLNFFTNGRPLEMLLSDVRTIHFYDGDKKEALPAINLRKKFKVGFDEIEYVMEGRQMVKFPKIGLGTKDKGVVVVDVTIDKYGNVISADPGAPGSKTTDDKYLFVKAKSACQQAKFNNDRTAPLSTKGKIFVVFP